MARSTLIPDDTPSGGNERTGWHACIAAAVLIALVLSIGACGDEDFTVGGPLPMLPTVNATNPSATPDDF